MRRAKPTSPPAEELWRDALLSARERALDDLALTESAAVVFVRHKRVAASVEFLDLLVDRAAARGFVTARVGVFEERAFDTFDALVRAIGRGLRAPRATPEARGVLSLLEEFSHAHGSRALARFEREATALHAAGDLFALARAYLDAKRQSTHGARQIEAWLSGTDLSRLDDQPAALAPLSARTAKRALREITLISRVLGHRGTLIVFEGADVIPRLPAGRREAAYTVIRELIDNTDGARGLVSTQLLVSSGPVLFEGPRSIRTLRPLAMRVFALSTSTQTPPPPHQSLVDLEPPEGWTPTSAPHGSRAPSGVSPLELRAVIRASQGLPAVDAAVSMSVAHERVDATITQLFSLSANRGSVFVPLVGAFGSGKTHLLLHLAARALSDKRPVFRLSLEQLDVDLGNPQRHLYRLLSQASLPLAGQPSLVDRLVAWTRTPLELQRVLKELERIADEGGDVAPAARRALRLATATGARPAAALEAFLTGAELAQKTSAPHYRQDAYARILLWLALLERIDGCRGPIFILDEAENLYRPGTTRGERRTAYRSLSFYCGGTLPGACVVLAITPDALADLRRESLALLDDLAQQKTTLSWEDVEMFRRRLRAAKPIEVPALTQEHRTVLAFRIRAAHERVRGKATPSDTGWAAFVESLVSVEITARELVRRVVDRLERRWWNAGGEP